MPANYSAVDPLAEALRGLREGWGSAADRRRQRELDAMQREDRQLTHGEMRRRREDLDYQTYGQRPVEAPPEITVPGYRGVPDLGAGLEARDPFEGKRLGMPRDTAPDLHGFDFGAFREIGLGRAPDPFRGALPGSYVLGAGFNSPRRTPTLQSRPLPVRFDQTEADPAFAQVGEGRWIDRRETPGARARALQEEQVARLEALISELDGVSPAQSAALAHGVPANVAFHDPRPKPPTASITRGGVTVQGVPLEQVSGVRAGLPEDDPDAASWQRFDTAEGSWAFNPKTLEVRPLQAPGGGRLTPRPTGTNRPSEMQARMRVAYSRAIPALQRIESFLNESGRIPETSFLDKVTPGRYFQPEDVQAYNQAAEAIASAILRIESGAAISEHEIRSYKKQFIPQPGDKPEVIQQKLDALRVTLEAIRQAAGISEEGGAPADSPLETTSIDHLLGGRP